MTRRTSSDTGDVIRDADPLIQEKRGAKQSFGRLLYSLLSPLSFCACILKLQGLPVSPWRRALFSHFYFQPVTQDTYAYRGLLTFRNDPRGARVM